MLKTTKLKNNYETVNLVERRLALLVGAKFKDRKKIQDIISEMNKIRERITKKSKNFNGTSVIRKWRDERCKF